MDSQLYPEETCDFQITPTHTPDAIPSTVYILVVTGVDAKAKFEQAFPSQREKCKVAKLIERHETIDRMPVDLRVKLQSIETTVNVTDAESLIPQEIAIFDVSEYDYLDYDDSKFIEQLPTMINFDPFRELDLSSSINQSVISTPCSSNSSSPGKSPSSLRLMRHSGALSVGSSPIRPRARKPYDRVMGKLSNAVKALDL